MGFKKATKEQAFLRLALFGGPGDGKSFSALRIATGLAGADGKIAAIDTESKSLSKYSDRFDFDVVELSGEREGSEGEPNIANVVSWIMQAEVMGYNVLVIDSLSHSWKELLDDVDKIAKAKYGGNSFAAWSEGTTKQRKLVNAILGFQGHVIATMRAKIEYVVEKDDRGKTAPRKIGLAPEQGKGIEYEFDMLISMSQEHIGHVIKDRTGKYQDELIERPDEKFGENLYEWLYEGAERARKDYNVVPFGENEGKTWADLPKAKLEASISYFKKKPGYDSDMYILAIEKTLSGLPKAKAKANMKEKDVIVLADDDDPHADIDDNAFSGELEDSDPFTTKNGLG